MISKSSLHLYRERPNKEILCTDDFLKPAYNIQIKEIRC